MRVQLTGMNPRTASERAREQVTFARTLCTVLTELGHEVTREPEARDVDLVMVGVTSAISPGATYALVGLEAIGRAQQQGTPLLLFVDDPALDKTKSGAASALRDLTRLYSPYLRSKRITLLRNPTVEQFSRIEAAVGTLASEQWPMTLLPMHPWGSAAIATRRLGVWSEVVALDISAANKSEVTSPPISIPRAPLWLTNRRYSEQTLDPKRVRWPVITVDSAALPSPVTAYAAVRGVHQGVTARIPGWWTPTPLQVAQARTVCLLDTEESMRIGTSGPYYLTPDEVESLSDEDTRELAEAQAAHLEDVTWNLETLSSVLAVSIGRASSSARPDTSSPLSPTS